MQDPLKFFVADFRKILFHIDPSIVHQDIDPAELSRYQRVYGAILKVIQPA